MKLAAPLSILALALACRFAVAASAATDLDEVLRAVPNLEHGAQLFETCAQCHGPHGGGLPSGWVPQIAGQHPRVLAKELIDYRHRARWDDRMEKIAGRHLLTVSQDIADVTAYVASLAPARTGTVGSGEWLGRGRHLYEAHCRSCHGADGEGDNAKFVPRVAGQQCEYLLRQLHDAVDGRRPNLVRGHVQLLRDLGMEELEGLADYISRLPGSPQHPDERTAAAGPSL